MDLSKLMLMFAVALGGLAVGCKSDCESACDDYKDCPGANSDTDCSETCTQEEDAMARLGCKSQLEDLSRCVADVDDICTFDQAKQCPRQNDALNACAAKYCGAHSDDYDCQSHPYP